MLALQSSQKVSTNVVENQYTDVGRLCCQGAKLFALEIRFRAWVHLFIFNDAIVILVCLISSKT